MVVETIFKIVLLSAKLIFMFKFLLEITSHFEAPQERPLALIFIYNSRTDVSHIYRGSYMAAWGYEF